MHKVFYWLVCVWFVSGVHLLLRDYVLLLHSGHRQRHQVDVALIDRRHLCKHLLCSSVFLFLQRSMRFYRIHTMRFYRTHTMLLFRTRTMHYNLLYLCHVRMNTDYTYMCAFHDKLVLSLYGPRHILLLQCDGVKDRLEQFDLSSP